MIGREVEAIAVKDDGTIFWLKISGRKNIINSLVQGRSWIDVWILAGIGKAWMVWAALGIGSVKSFAAVQQQAHGRGSRRVVEITA